MEEMRGRITTYKTITSKELGKDFTITLLFEDGTEHKISMHNSPNTSLLIQSHRDPLDEDKEVYGWEH
jgi:hypothetical protein